MNARRANEEVEKLRGFRVWARDQSLTGEIVKQTRALIKLHKALDGIGERWGSLLPKDLAARTSLQGLSRGVLTVRVADAATDYELDRWIRGGGLEALRRAGASVTKVKTVYERASR